MRRGDNVTRVFLIFPVFGFFNDTSSSTLTWDGNSVHPNVADNNTWCYFPVVNFTQNLACTGTAGADSSYQVLLYTHLNLPEGYSIAYYALNNLTLLGNSNYKVPYGGARLCLSGQASDGGYQTLCMTTVYDNNIYYTPTGRYCIVKTAQTYVSDGCYKAMSSPAANATRTASSTLSATTYTSAAAVETSADSQTASRLKSCKPCGSQQCSYNNITNLTSETYPIFIGAPVSNCDNGSATLTFTIGGTREVATSWSETNTIGADIFGVNVQVQVGYTYTQTLTVMQSVSIPVNPGYMGGLIADVIYKRASGVMSIGTGQQIPMTLNHPDKIATYEAHVIPCGSQFAVSNPDQTNCTAHSGALPRGMNSPMMMVSLFSLMVALLALILL